MAHSNQSNQSDQPAYGSQLLPQVLDDLATSKPERIYASFPKTFDLKDGFRDVTVLQMSRAVNAIAWWLEKQIGKSSTFETVSYLGPPDLRYAIVFLAAVKCGYKVLLPSPRNTTWINNSLLDQTECTKFIVAPEMVPKAKMQQEEKKELEILLVPSLDDMLVNASENYPYQKDFATARWDPIVVLHSSGSTGAPKPIVMNHATFAVIDNDRNLPTVSGRRNQNFSLWNFGESGGFSFSSFPPFHLGGFIAYIALPIYSSESSLVLGPADKPSTGQTAAEVMRRFDLKALFCPPNIYEQLLQEPDAIERAKKLKFLMYAGGPLTTATGTALSKVTDVCGFYGSTETSPVQALVPLREDWDTLEFHPLYGADFQPSDDDAYELVLHHDPKLEGVRGLDCNFRDIEEWRTKDLFRPHATKPNLWRFHGRTDDIIVLSNGEKLNPVPSEAIINSHPLVSAALIVGQGHFQAALLVEPVKTARSSSELIDELWPTIEKANAQAQSHGRIIRSMIAIAGPSKPFERAGKGTVVRRLTAEKFAGEIEALYSDLESGNLQGGPTLSDSKDAGSVQEFVSRAVAFSFPLEDIKPSDDLYVLGLDSLKTVEVVAVLKSGLGNQDTRWLSSRTLYGNPTIERLSRSLHSKLNTDQNGDSKIMDEVHEDINMMASLVHEYSKDLPGAKPATVSASVWSKCVVLTGSTGSLGKRLLRRLLASPHVTKVYCLDRNVNASSKHTDTLASEKNKSRVEFLQVEYGQPTFGLSAPKYEELLKSVDTIIHSAWKVNFNHSLESFEPVHIRGVRNLVDLQIRNPRKPRMIFISSISSVSRWPTLGDNKGPIPDNFIPNFDAAQIMGYGESKHVAEHILYEAGEITGVASTILRVGQIAGPLSSNGVWNEDEWVPALIKSSKALGCLPNGIPDVDWIPVDSLASIITELSLSAPPAVLEEKGASFFNLVNPHLTAWKTLLETLKEHLGPSTEVVPLEKWIKRLQDLDANDPKVIAQYPAVKILDFFESLSEQQKFGKVQYSTTKSCEASKTMASLPAVGSAAMKVWLKQWGY